MLHTNQLEKDGQIERVNQILEDMLRMYVMDRQNKWEEYLHLVEFAYNNGYHSSIGRHPFRHCMGDLVEHLSVGIIWRIGFS